MAYRINTDEQGYDDTRFESRIKGDLLCSICQGVLKNPRTCQNKEHPFCHSCISQHLRYSRTCPACREYLTPNTLKDPSRFLKNTLSELNIKCDYSERGCPNYVQLENLQNHVKRCGFAPVMCRNEGCRMMVNEKDKEIHEKVFCRVSQDEIKKNNDKIKDSQEQMKIELNEMKDNITRMKREQENIKDEMNEIKEKITIMERKPDQTMYKMMIIGIIMIIVQQALQGTNTNNNYAQAIVAANQQDIIIIGGYYATRYESVLKTIEKYNIAEGKSTLLPAMNLARGASASCVYNGEVIVTGGHDGVEGTDSIEILNLNRHPSRWTGWRMFVTKLPTKLYHHDLTVYKDHLYITGGYNWSEKKTSDIIYKQSLAPPYTVKLLARMPTPRRYHKAEIVNDQLFILGGSTTASSKDSINSVVVYDFVKNEMKPCPSLPKPVRSMSTVVWGNMIILVGGKDKDKQVLNDVIMYDTETGRSERLPSLKHKRHGASAVIMNDVIVVLGGKNKEEGYLNSVESFKIGDDQWKELPKMKGKRFLATAVAKPRN